jgi:ATP-binding cassette, subfamily B, bacterial MsbA
MSKKRKAPRMKLDTTGLRRLRKSWSYVFPYFHGHRAGILMVMLLTVIASTTDSLLALSVKPGLDWFLFHPEIGKKIVWVVPAFIVGIFVFRGTFDFSSKYWLEKICIKVLQDIQISLFEHIVYLSVDHYDRTGTGEMMARTTADATYMSRLVPILIDCLKQSFKLIGLLSVCFWKKPELTGIALVAIPLTVFPVQRLSDRMKRYTKRSLKQIADVNTVLQEAFVGARVIKAFAREREEVQRFSQEMNLLLKSLYIQALTKNLISPVLGVVASIGVGTVAYIITGRIVNHIAVMDEISRNNMLGDYSTFIIAVGLMFDPVRRLGELFGHFSGATGAVERIQATFETMSTIVEAPDAVEIEPIARAIRYEDVSFKYYKNRDELILDHLNLTITKGELVAVVGETGSGKTTVANLLPRFYDVTGGRITIDGQDIRNATFKSLRNQIGVVNQDTFLFNTTIIGNIKYGSEHKSDEEAMAAARAAYAHDFITCLPNGYQSTVGERGVRLSGGQRQRLSIARALLKDPPILILDEATSALDTGAEREVQKALDLLMKNRTTIAIAHRLSTIRHADKIVVIKDGKVIEQGAHVELMAHNGEYRRLYEMQFFLGKYATDHYGEPRGDEDGVCQDKGPTP